MKHIAAAGVGNPAAQVVLLLKFGGLLDQAVECAAAVLDCQAILEHIHVELYA